MNFHIVITTAKEAEWQRKDCVSDADTEEIACYYGTLLQCGADLTLNFEDGKIKGFVIEHSYDTAIMNLEIEGKLGLGILILGGNKASSREEQRYCKLFSKKMGFAKWYLPMPPLEIESRPLFYYVLFKLTNDYELEQEWDDLVERVISRANGLGVAFLSVKSIR